MSIQKGKKNVWLFKVYVCFAQKVCVMDPMGNAGVVAKGGFREAGGSEEGGSIRAVGMCAGRWGNMGSWK